MGVFPSGQWGQTVNLLLSASVVRIHPRPPKNLSVYNTLRFLFCDKAKLIERVDSNSCGAVAEDSTKTAQWAVFSSAARAIHPRPPRTPVSNGYRSFCFICLAKGAARVDSNSIDPPNSPAGKKAPVQQRRPLPAAETGRSCWGCGQQDARAAQGTMQPLRSATQVPFLRGSRHPPAPTKKPQRIKIRCGFALRYFFLLFCFALPSEQLC